MLPLGVGAEVFVTLVGPLETEIGEVECFGLFTLVLDLANSRRIACGKSGSKRALCKSRLAVSACARVVNVMKPTGDEDLPVLLVTLSSEPS